ncbi:MAG: hypothetical protein P0Y50_08935 [Candidatus Brevundimonas colombiensis]|uniref:Uncharacterized protein n=1 Tax=Candidatus Brevundimonas colombiensis TaxID=3121376 RepID=A0AAJ6BJU0_9CAUL|nr:hypothetical protein [Brevundimonas sp.]WEK38677.1 MAG: hypothetical protein P0Y50_08935 [Brevundimonas sp.]
MRDTANLKTRLMIGLMSSRAPYTRAGIDFASNREAVLVEQGSLDATRILRLVDDVAINFRLVDPVTDVFADVPRDLIGVTAEDPEGVARFDAIVAELLDRVEAAEKAQAAAEKAAEAEAKRAARAAADQAKADKAAQTESAG